MIFATKKKKNAKIDFDKVFKWNVIGAVILAIEGVLILVLSGKNGFPVTTNFLTADPLATQTVGHTVLTQATRHMFDVNLAYLIAAFFFISAIIHALVASVFRNHYEASLKKGINPEKWIAFALSGGVMIVVIAMIVGVSDLSTLLVLFFLTAITGLVGLLMEMHKATTKEINWVRYIIGGKTAIFPWLIFAIYLIGSNTYGSGNVPAYVYWVFATLFALFVGIAVNTYLQQTKKDKWADFMFGERLFMILAFVAQAALAWQIYAGALRT